MRPASARPPGRRALGVFAALLLLAPSASADQTSARDEPDVSGPLELVDEGCSGGGVRHEGRRIARVMSCVRLYQFDEVMESDPLRSYGVAWVQTTVDAARGWCTKAVNTNIVLGTDIERHGRAPAQRIRIYRPRPLRVHLAADANGYGMADAWIAQRVTAFRGTLTPSTGNEGRLLRLTWAGRRQGAKLAFAMGAEISWGYFAGPEIRAGLGQMRFVKRRRC